MISKKKRFFCVPPGEYSIGFKLNNLNDLKKEYPLLNENHALNSCPGYLYTLSEKMCISNRLVTCDEFMAFVSETGYVTLAEREGWGWVLDNGWKKAAGVSLINPFNSELNDYYFKYSEDMPAMQLSWFDAEAYCGWYSEKYMVSAFLPGEALWEASRIILEKNDMSTAHPEVIDNYSFLKTIKSIIDVSGIHPPGILWEWTADWFSGYPGAAPNKEFGMVYKVLKGGSLFSEKFHKHRAYRFRRCPTARSPYYGFRIAISE